MEPPLLARKRRLPRQHAHELPQAGAGGCRRARGEASAGRGARLVGAVGAVAIVIVERAERQRLLDAWASRQRARPAATLLGLGSAVPLHAGAAGVTLTLPALDRLGDSIDPSGLGVAITGVL